MEFLKDIDLNRLKLHMGPSFQEFFNSLRKYPTDIQRAYPMSYNILESGFEIPFKDLPKYLDSSLSLGRVVRYRLEVGR